MKERYTGSRIKTVKGIAGGIGECGSEAEDWLEFLRRIYYHGVAGSLRFCLPPLRRRLPGKPLVIVRNPKRGFPRGCGRFGRRRHLCRRSCQKRGCTKT